MALAEFLQHMKNKFKASNEVLNSAEYTIAKKKQFSFLS